MVWLCRVFHQFKRVTYAQTCHHGQARGRGVPAHQVVCVPPFEAVTSRKTVLLYLFYLTTVAVSVLQNTNVELLVTKTLNI